MGELKEIFEEFEKIQSEKTKKKYCLPDTERLYDTYLKIWTDKIITVVENAIKHAKQQLEKVQKEKEERVKAMLNILLKDYEPYESFNPEQSFKTLRKLPLYGWIQGN